MLLYNSNILRAENGELLINYMDKELEIEIGMKHNSIGIVGRYVYRLIEEIFEKLNKNNCLLLLNLFKKV